MVLIKVFCIVEVFLFVELLLVDIFLLESILLFISFGRLIDVWFLILGVLCCFKGEGMEIEIIVVLVLKVGLWLFNVVGIVLGLLLVGFVLVVLGV